MGELLEYVRTIPARHWVAWGLLLLVSPAGKAAVDVLTQKAGRNIFERLGKWFDARTSWKRKYKDYPYNLESRFPFSKTALVFITDFWHAADSVFLYGWQLAAVLFLPLESWPARLVLLALLKFGFGGTFELLYNRVFTSKTESPPPAEN